MDEPEWKRALANLRRMGYLVEETFLQEGAGPLGAALRVVVEGIPLSTDELVALITRSNK